MDDAAVSFQPDSGEKSRFGHFPHVLSLSHPSVHRICLTDPNPEMADVDCSLSPTVLIVDVVHGWSCPVSVDSERLSDQPFDCPSPFGGTRRQVVERRMSPVRVVEAPDVVEECQPRRVARRERLSREQFAVEGGEETLPHRVVEAIAPTAYRGDYPGLALPPPEGVTRGSASLVRIVDDSGGSSPPERHLDRFDDRLGA